MKNKNFNVRGKIILNKVWSKPLKNGTVKEYRWKDEVVDARVIRARTDKEAIQQFKQIQ